MKTLVLLSLCSVASLRPVASRILPGLCEIKQLQDQMACNGSLLGSYCPQCDARGNFLPQQCWPSTGYCWCVDVLSGDEIPGTSTPPGTPRVDCDELGHWSCPDGWSNFGETCFTFISTPKKWIEAEVYCQFDGGNLASVHSQEENHFIMSLTRGSTNNFPQTWLGGFDAIHPGYWMWSDGSDFNYENWYNNPHGEEEGDGGDGGDDGDDGDDGDGGDGGDNGDDGDNGDNGDDGDGGDDHHDKPQSNDHCLKINYEYDLTWFHDSCTTYLPFVCAKKAHRAPH